MINRLVSVAPASMQLEFVVCTDQTVVAKADVDLPTLCKLMLYVFNCESTEYSACRAQ